MKALNYFILSILMVSFFSCNETANIEIEKKSKSFDSIQPLICGSRSNQILPRWKNGTFKELQELIHSQLIYPEGEYIQGTTVLTFIIDGKGKIESTKIYRSISKSIDNQLEELIRKYKFEPGTVNGHPSKFSMTFPFRIELL